MKTLRTDFIKLKKILAYIKPWAIPFSVALFLMSIQNVLINYIVASLEGGVLDAVTNLDMSGTLWAVARFAILFAVGLAVVLWGFLTLSNTSAKATGLLRAKLFEKMMRLRMDDYSKHHSGDLVSRLTSDIDKVSGALSWSLMMPLMCVTGAITGCVVTFVMCWEIGLVYIGIAAISLASGALFAGPMRRVSLKIQELAGDQTSRFIDIISGARVIRLYRLFSVMAEKFGSVNGKLLSQTLKSVRIRMASNAVTNIADLLQWTLVPLIGFYMISNGRLTLGSLFIIIEFGGSMSWAIMELGNSINNLQQSLAGADRVLEILDIETETDDAGSTLSDVLAEPAISFENVSFSYRDGEPIFKNLSFAVPGRRMAALVGSSGGGKTTALKLLMRFYDPAVENEDGTQSGGIRIFGRPIEEYSLKSLREMMSYVPQTPHLFDGTIYDNIAWGREGASREEIERAAKAAYAHEFITEMPEGYDTKVGERGVQLSGGQRQRIAIARAMLKDAPILLLDEATSALDSQSEAYVQEAINSLMAGRTILVVAHRLSTVEHADEILVLEGGGLSERGKHSELINNQGTYAKLYNMQFANQQSGDKIYA